MNYFRNDDRKTDLKKGFQNPDFLTASQSKLEKSGGNPKEKNHGKKDKKKVNTSGTSPEELNKMIYEALERNRIPNVFYEELEPLELLSLSERNTSSSGFYNGFTVECPTAQKRAEKNRRLSEIKTAMEKIKFIKQLPDYDEEELSDLLKTINRIKAEFMTENKFFGYKGKDEDAFNYGREVVKGSLDELNPPPYKRIALFQAPAIMQLGSSSTREHNFVFSGVKRGALMKGGVRLSPAEETDHEPDKDFNIKFEFDIYERYLLNLFRDSCAIKVRFYILRALNLAAQSSATQIKYELGGYNALSSADPYPMVSVGDAKNNIDSGLTKTVNDSNNYVEQDLNPDFYKLYELDAFIPADWKLVLKIYNKGKVMDSLIGEREIDIEDRYFSDIWRLRSYAFQKRSEYYKDKIKRLSNQTPVPLEEIEAMENEQLELTQYLKPKLQNRPSYPIEYCFLTQPGLNTMQGSAEILIEPLHSSELRKVPAAKFEPPKPIKYQIRLIIWEAFDIPKGDKKAVDVFFKVTLDNEGWATDEITKETDTHLGSDGYCIYNWRMTFDLMMPCAFPRLKICAFDMATFGSDESIGEVTLKFDNIMNKLKTEGRYEAPQKKVRMKNQKKGGEDAGDVLISFKIITSAEAASVPVGEGQEEPNTDPVLDKPKIGRGIGDFLKSMSFNFNFNLGFFFMLMKYGALALGALMMFVVMFINPGILTGG